MAESTKRHEENSNIIKEIRASTDAAIRNQGALIKTLEIQIGQMRPYAVSDAQYNSLSSEAVSFPSRLHGYCSLIDLRESVSVMSFSTYSNLGLGDLAHTRLTIELADRTIKHPRGIAENVLVRIVKDKGDHEGKNLAGTLIDIPIFVWNFSIILGFSITDNMDIISGVVLDAIWDEMSGRIATTPIKFGVVGGVAGSEDLGGEREGDEAESVGIGRGGEWELGTRV
ncbi:hypothetical protein Tco_0759201 [Tanacetum coccineum]